MYLPIDGKVLCGDVEVGHTTCVIIDPTKQRITDIVVSLANEQIQHLVPITFIEETTLKLIRLNCSMQTIQKQVRFSVNKLVCVPNVYYPSQHEQARTLFTYSTAGEEEIPQGEIAIHVGARIHAVDGRLGTISEFVIDQDDQITHVVLDEAHWYGTQHSLITVDAIHHVEKDAIVLTLTKDAVAHLPHRLWISHLKPNEHQT